MSWIFNKREGCYEHDGKPFDPPDDSFEREYNQRLKDGDDLEDEIFDPVHGWPVSMRSYTSKFRDAAHVRSAMDQFFGANFQRMCLGSGNTPAELDELASRLLTHAAKLRAPVTDRERVIAKRLGIDVEANPRQRETGRK